tara:strand:+ start:587 stop:910 length:324 start_codon:yes stop_codon:yes gene_type:complete
MPKKKIIQKLSKGDLSSVLNTIEMLFNNMSNDEKKVILKKIGVSKIDIEKLDNNGLVNKVKSTYKSIIENIDLNNFTLDNKYKEGAEFLSKKNKSILKTEIENYKKL